MRDREHDKWIPWYVDDTPGWLQLSLAARGAAEGIARKLNDKTGALYLRRGLESLAVLLHVSWSELEPAMQELCASGKFIWDETGRTLRDPDFGERKRPSNADRVARFRERQRVRGEASTYPDETDVTPVTLQALPPLRETPVTDVTLPLVSSDLISSDLISSGSRSPDLKQNKEQDTGPAESSEDVTKVRRTDRRPDEVWDHYVATVSKHRPRRRPGKLSPKDRRTITELLRLGRTVTDINRAIDGLFRSPFHLGQNDRDTEYLELGIALRNPERFAAIIDEDDRLRARAEPERAEEPTATPEQLAEFSTRLEGILGMKII